MLNIDINKLNKGQAERVLFGSVFMVLLAACSSSGGSSDKSSSSPSNNKPIEGSSLSSTVISTSSSLSSIRLSSSSSSASSVGASTSAAVSSLSSAISSMSNQQPNGWLFKDDKQTHGICFEINGSQVTQAYYAELLAKGAQSGSCPDIEYAASCDYKAENRSEATMWFYPELSSADARATCGTNGGVYTLLNGEEDDDDDYFGPIYAPPGTPPNPPFIEPLNILRNSSSGEPAFCFEAEAVKLPTQVKNSMIASGFIQGNCATQNYLGLCYRPNPVGFPMKEFWYRVTEGAITAGALKVQCEETAGVWTSF